MSYTIFLGETIQINRHYQFLNLLAKSARVISFNAIIIKEIPNIINGASLIETNKTNENTLKHLLNDQKEIYDFFQQYFPELYQDQTIQNKITENILENIEYTQLLSNIHLNEPIHLYLGSNKIERQAFDYCKQNNIITVEFPHGVHYFPEQQIKSNANYQIIENELCLSHCTNTTKFKPTGIPIDTSISPKKPKNFKELVSKVKTKPILTIFGSWIQQDITQNIIKNQINYINNIQRFLRHLSNHSLKNKVSLILKLHPAMQLNNSTIQFFDSLAAKEGIKFNFITTSRLYEIVHLSDFCLVTSNTTVLNDLFHSEKLTFSTTDFLPNPNLIPPFVIHNNNNNELLNNIEFYLNQKNKEKQIQKIKSLKKTYNINEVSTKEKSINCIKWFDEIYKRHF